MEALSRLTQVELAFVLDFRCQSRRRDTTKSKSP